MTAITQQLLKIADRIEAWAAESREGGWSTHQCHANLLTACEIREVVAHMTLAELRALVRSEPTPLEEPDKMSVLDALVIIWGVCSGGPRAPKWPRQQAAIQILQEHLKGILA